MADDFDALLADYMTDLNGDGVPDGMVTTAQPQGRGRDITRGFRPRYAGPPRAGPSPDQLGARWQAAGAAAIDPFGATSAGLDYFGFPESAQALRGAQAAHPDAAMVGGIASPVNFLMGPIGQGVGRFASAGLKGAAKAGGAPAAIGGTIGLTADAGETEAQRRRRRSTRRGRATPEPRAATPQEALRNSNPLWDKVKDDPALSALYQQMEEAERTATSPVRGVNAATGDKIRSDARDTANNLRQKLIDELGRRNPPQLPFEKEYQWAAKNLPMLQAGAGLATGALLKTGSNMASRIDMAPWIGAVQRGERALEPGMFNRAQNIDRAARNANVASAFNEAYRPASGVGQYATPVIGAGVVGGEIGLFPHQYNIRNAPEGSPERAAAERALGTLEGFASTVAKGAIPAALGGFTGAHFPLVPAARAPTARTNALAQNVAEVRQGPSQGYSRPVPPNDGGPPAGPGDNSLGPPQGPPTNVPYQSVRPGVRDAYRDSVLDAGGPLNPQSAAANMSALADDSGIRLTGVNLPSRIQNTNQAIAAFVQQNGRLPTSRGEWEQFIWNNRRTLAVPAAIGAGAEPVTNVLAQYMGQQPRDF